ncbi:MAG: hypothetical protein JRF57_16470 [Deltaproteobacteria bacterium]|nr:hypothetical protein [Deltaproteobacteria bacterium]
MKGITVGKKIAAGFGLMILLSMIIGGGGILKTTQVSNDVNDLCETHLPLAVLGGELADTAAMQRNPSSSCGSGW